MGFTGLARWTNAPTTGLDLVKQNILRNHAGRELGKWFLTVRSFRTVSGQTHGMQLDRSMCALTMNSNTFVLLEDPAAPAVSDLTMSPVNPSGTGSLSTPKNDSTELAHQGGYSHLRTTLATVSPPNALEQLLIQLGARWASTRQQPSTSARNPAVSTGNQLVIDGSIFSIGSDWLVRVGNVILTGGAVKGMLLEAEYLPLPKLASSLQGGASELLSNLLTSILPDVPNAYPVAVTVEDSQWEEVLWNNTGSGDPTAHSQISQRQNGGDDDDDAFVYEDEQDPSIKQKGDWTGVDRDRRSAFLIIGALKSEGIL